MEVLVMDICVLHDVICHVIARQLCLDIVLCFMACLLKAKKKKKKTNQKSEYCMQS